MYLPDDVSAIIIELINIRKKTFSTAAVRGTVISVPNNSTSILTSAMECFLLVVHVLLTLLMDMKSCYARNLYTTSLDS